MSAEAVADFVIINAIAVIVEYPTCGFAYAGFVNEIVSPERLRTLVHKLIEKVKKPDGKKPVRHSFECPNCDTIAMTYANAEDSRS